MPPMPTQAQSQPAMPPLPQADAQNYMVNGHAPVFRPLDQEGMDDSTMPVMNTAPAE